MKTNEINHGDTVHFNVSGNNVGSGRVVGFDEFGIEIENKEGFAGELNEG